MHIRNFISTFGSLSSLGSTANSQTDRSSDSEGEPTLRDAGPSVVPRANIQLLLVMFVTIVVCAACSHSNVSNGVGGGGAPSSDWGAMQWNQDVWG